jgi:hypothetical protein
MILEVIIALFLAILLFAWYMGAFISMDIHEETFPGGTYIYLDYRDKLSNLHKTYMRIMKDENEF